MAGLWELPQPDRTVERGRKDDLNVDSNGHRSYASGVTMERHNRFHFARIEKSGINEIRCDRIESGMSERRDVTLLCGHAMQYGGFINKPDLDSVVVRSSDKVDQVCRYKGDGADNIEMRPESPTCIPQLLQSVIHLDFVFLHI
jgi:hypothetical protein